MNTPILFIIFNRPDTTEKVFNTIRSQKPKRLYIAADGPRSNRPGEDLLCKETREVVSKIDWDCEVKTLFRDHNLGCGKTVSGAIDWFFENEEMGIILEDDCLPSSSFYSYCEYFLEKYKGEPKVFTITGYNFFTNKIKPNEISFSRYTHVWGWATWRRVWKNFDFNLEHLETEKESMKKYLLKDEYEYWVNQFRKILTKEMDTWDYQLQFLCFKEGGLTILPPRNLIKNIGFDERATHTQIGNWLSIDVEELDNFKSLVPNTIKENSKLSNLIWSKLHKRKSIFQRIVFRLFGLRV